MRAQANAHQISFERQSLSCREQAQHYPKIDDGLWPHGSLTVINKPITTKSHGINGYHHKVHTKLFCGTDVSKLLYRTVCI